jgi:hypothetical protein
MVADNAVMVVHKKFVAFGGEVGSLAHA